MPAKKLGVSLVLGICLVLGVHRVLDIMILIHFDSPGGFGSSLTLQVSPCGSVRFMTTFSVRKNNDQRAGKDSGNMMESILISLSAYVHMYRI